MSALPPRERPPSPPAEVRPESAGWAARTLPLSIGLALSAVFLWLALRDGEVGVLLDILSRAAWWPLLPYALALVALYWLKAERWRLLIRAEHAAKVSRLVDPMMMGFAANNVFPLRAGEFIRVYAAGRTLGVAKTEVLASLVVERVLDLLSVAVLTSGSLLFVHLRDTADGQDGRVLGAALLALLLSGAGLALLFALVGRDLSPLARWVPNRFRARAEALLQRFTVGLEPIAERRRLLPTLSSSLVQWALLALCIHLSIVAVGVELRSVPVAMIVLGLVVLGISLPSGPAYVGTIEYAFVLGLGFFGVASEEALAAAIYYHAFMFASVTGAGAVCWARYSLAGRAGRSTRAQPPSR